MALIEQVEPLPDELPQTHIFIVGVGHYKYLLGGASPVIQSKFEDLGLGQLSSPSISARAFYETVMNIYREDRWIRPLGSVELLISTTDDQFSDLTVEHASLKNIQDRYFEWKARCHNSEDNVAIFFFCGHGLEKFSQYLLADDFGENGNNPWAGAFDFDSTRAAFHECRAKTQIFLVDACRQATAAMILHNLTIQSIDQYSQMSPHCRYNATIKATSHNEGSYAKPHEVSFFTQALIKGMVGYAATCENDVWLINTNNLAISVNKIISMNQSNGAFEQKCESDISLSNNIIRLSAPPKISLEISCLPDEATSLAALSYTHAENVSITSSRLPTPEPWRVNIEAGIYQLKANFSQPPYKDASKYVSVVPPFTKEKLLCHEQ